MAKILALVMVGVDKFSKPIGDGFKKVNVGLDKFQGMAAGAGLAAGAALTAGFAGALDTGKAQAKMQAQLGLTKSQSASIGTVAGKLFADAYGDSMQDVNAAITSVIQNMDGMRGASSSVLQATTARAMNLATVLDEDVGRVTMSVSQLMRTGLAKNAQEAFDVLTRGEQLGANKAGDLLDTFNEYPTQFRKLGLSGAEAMGLISQGLRAGARDSDIVADALKEFSIRAVDGSKLTAQGFQMIGLNAGTMASAIGKGGKSAEAALGLVLTRLRAIKDPVMQSQAAVALFGTQAEDMGKALFALDTTKAVGQLGNFKGATDRAGQALGESASAKIEMFKRSMQQSVVNFIGNSVIPAVSAIGKAFGALGIKPQMLLALAAAIGLIVGGVKAWSIAQGLLNTVMNANPIVRVISIVLLLVTALVSAYQNSETFRKIVQNAWAVIQKVIAYAWNNIIKPVVAAFVAYYRNVLGPVIMWFWKNIIQPAWTAISFVIKVAWGIVKIILAAWWMYMQKVVAPVVLWLWRTIFKPAFDAIGAVVKAVWNNVVKPIFEVMKSGVSLVGKAFDAAAKFIGKVWDKVREYARKPVEFVLYTIYQKGIKGVWDKVADFVHAPHLPDAPKFARGGRIAAGSTSRADDVLIRASRGEFVVNADATRKHLPLLAALNGGMNRDQAARQLRLGDPGGIIPGFADGGIIGWVKSFAAKAKDFFINGIENAANAVFNPIRSLLDGTLGTTGLGGMIGGVPKSYMDSFLVWLEEHKSTFEGGPGQKAVNAGRKWMGVPYSWGGGTLTGPSRGFAQGANTVGFDCSSFVRAAWYAATKKVMPRTSEAQWPWVSRGGDVRPGDLGFTHFGSSGPGHVVMATGKGGVIQAPHTGSHVYEAQLGYGGYSWGRPPASFLRADSGSTTLRPGANLVMNGTGRAEPLVSPGLSGNITVQQLHVHVEYGVDELTAGRKILNALRVAINRDGKTALRRMVGLQ